MKNLSKKWKVVNEFIIKCDFIGIYTEDGDVIIARISLCEFDTKEEAESVAQHIVDLHNQNL